MQAVSKVRVCAVKSGCCTHLCMALRQGGGRRHKRPRLGTGEPGELICLGRRGRRLLPALLLAAAAATPVLKVHALHALHAL